MLLPQTRILNTKSIHISNLHRINGKYRTVLFSEELQLTSSKTLNNNSYLSNWTFSTVKFVNYLLNQLQEYYFNRNKQVFARKKKKNSRSISPAAKWTFWRSTKILEIQTHTNPIFFKPQKINKIINQSMSRIL